MITKTITAIGSKKHHRFTLNVQEDNTNISENKSYLSFTFKISKYSGKYDWRSWGSAISYTVTIDTNTYTGTIPNYDGTSPVTLKSGSDIPITHENDGTKTINIAFNVTDTSGQTYTSGNASASDTMELTTLHTPPDITSWGTTELNALIGTSYGAGKIINHLSEKKFTIRATTFDGATLSKFRVYNGTELLEEVTSSTSPTEITVDYSNVELQRTESGTQAIVYVEVEDSMNGVTRTGYDITIVNYNLPNIITTSSNIKRNGQSTGQVNLNLAATYTSGTIGLTTNDVTLEFAYWQKGQSESTTYYTIPETQTIGGETTIVINKNGNNIAISNWTMYKNGTLIQDVNKDYAYYFKIRITDAFNKTNVIQLLCASGEYIMCKFKDRVDFKKITQQGSEVQLKGESIFHSDSGDNTNITLSKNPFSHSIMEILGTDQNGVKSLYHKVLNPKENDVIDLSLVEAGTVNTFIKRTRYTLIGNAMQVSNAGSARITSNTASTTIGTNDIYITDVIVYK